MQRGKGGAIAVMEYSELDALKQHAINQDTGRLLYKWGNVRNSDDLWSFDFENYRCIRIRLVCMHTSSYCYLFGVQICLHMFSMDFLKTVSDELERDSMSVIPFS